MSVTELPAGSVPAIVRGVWFWVRRYGLAELGGTAAILVAALPLQAAGVHVAVVAAVAAVAESVGFYGVMAVAVHRELRQTAPRAGRVRRAAALLVAEFGPAEALDSLLIRPALVALALLTLGGTVALLAGKIAADLAFYGLAAVAFTLTQRLGWRSARVDD